MEVFQNYAYYYNAFYQDKDYKGEAEQIDFLLKKYGNNIVSLINYGCGTGRHDIELYKMGYRCTGVDFSPVMIDIAKQNVRKENMSITFTVADIRNYVPQKKYDGVLSLFHVMSYQNRNEDILAALWSARKALNVGGILLFDVWYGNGVLSDKPTVRVKEIEDNRNRLIRIARPTFHEKENIIDVNYEVLVIDKESSITKVINEVHNMRYFFRTELEMLLQQSGFELIDNVDCQTLGPTDYQSWTSYFIAKAI